MAWGSLSPLNGVSLRWRWYHAQQLLHWHQRVHGYSSPKGLEDTAWEIQVQMPHYKRLIPWSLWKTRVPTPVSVCMRPNVQRKLENWTQIWIWVKTVWSLSLSELINWPNPNRVGMGEIGNQHSAGEITLSLGINWYLWYNSKYPGHKS